MSSMKTTHVRGSFRVWTNLHASHTKAPLWVWNYPSESSAATTSQDNYAATGCDTTPCTTTQCRMTMKTRHDRHDTVQQGAGWRRWSIGHQALSLKWFVSPWFSLYYTNALLLFTQHCGNWPHGWICCPSACIKHGDTHDGVSLCLMPWGMGQRPISQSFAIPLLVPNMKTFNFSDRSTLGLPFSSAASHNHQ